MKKIKFLSLLIAMLGLFGLFSVVVNAEELPTEEVPTVEVTPEVEPTIYTYVAEDETIITISLLTETQCEITMGEERQFFDYVIVNGKVKIFGPNNEYMYVILDDESKTFTYYDYPKGIIIIEENEDGEITTSVLEAEVGTIVEIYAKPILLYETQQIIVNGNVLEINEEGYYTFELLEGENIIKGVFVVSDAKVEELANLINNVKKGNWDNIFNFDNLIKILYFIATTVFSGGFFAALIKYKKYKTLSNEEINKNVVDTLNTHVPESISKLLTDCLEPITTAINTKIDGSYDAMKILVKCFMLMQENTPESRLDILNEIEKINTDEAALSDKIKYLINVELDKKTQEIEERDKAIEELKTMNESIVVQENDSLTHL